MFMDTFLFREMGYDGVVLESWSRWAAYGILHDSNMRGLVSFQSVFLPRQYSLSLSLSIELLPTNLTLFVAIHY